MPGTLTGGGTLRPLVHQTADYVSSEFSLTTFSHHFICTGTAVVVEEDECQQ